MDKTRLGKIRVLHVLSQTELTGAEVYATSLADRQIKAGYDVTLVSDKLHAPTMAAVFYQPIAQRTWLKRFKNVLFLRKLITANKIDVVHAHSRAASWVCHWATKGTQAAYVSTVHGRQHLHLSLKFYDVYGDRVIAICENIRKHLVHEVGMKEAKISVVPNGFEFDVPDHPEEQLKPQRNIFIVGRTSGPKGRRSGHLIKSIIPNLMDKYSDLTVSIAGGPLSNFDRETIDVLNGLKKKFGSRIQAREFVARELMTQLIRKSSLVIGTGRLAMQALAAKKNLLAVGEACCHGLVTEGNLIANVSSNFGDILADKIESMDYGLLASELESYLEEPTEIKSDLVDKVRKFYAIEGVFEKVSSIYFEALLERRVEKNIPVLMYHKIVTEAYSSSHKTYLTEELFAQHLRILKEQGFTPITFQDVRDAALLDKSLPLRPIILTFDDGYRKTVQRVLPLLRRHEFRAVFYLLGNAQMTSNTWDASDEESMLLSDEEIRDLVDAGMEVGAHSVTHRKLSELPDQELHFEVLESKKYLEALSENEVISFAYPYGNLCSRTKNAVKANGFNFAVATDSGGLTIAHDRFQIFRASIFPQDGPARILKKASRFYRSYYYLTRGK